VMPNSVNKRNSISFYQASLFIVCAFAFVDFNKFNLP
jgi:hypothetical protein